MPRDGFARLDNVGNIRFAIFVQRRRHTDDDGLHLFDPREIRRGRQAPGLHRLADRHGVNMLDVASTGVDGLNF
jgi:hypothetical protein